MTDQSQRQFLFVEIRVPGVESYCWTFVHSLYGLHIEKGNMLNALSIGKSFGDKSLFQKLTLNLIAGQRIALVGLNGSGKTTLLDILAGETNPDN